MLQSMGSQRVRQDLAAEQQQQNKKLRLSNTVSNFHWPGIALGRKKTIVTRTMKFIESRD